MEVVRCCDTQDGQVHNGRGRLRGSCEHVQTFKQAGGLEAAKPIIQYLCICWHRILGSSSSLMIREGQLLTFPPRCFGCSPPGMGRRLHACLHCVFIGCWDGGHLATHLAEHSHTLALDATHGQLFCAACNDYVYDRDFEIQAAREQSTFCAVKQKLAEPRAKQVKYSTWAPSTEDLTQISSNARRCTVPESLLGLRGLHNMGNTCFMNCVLQSLLHNPLLRNYFLSDLHNRSGCTSRRDEICLACELDYLFAEVYSGVGTPYAPYHFLYSMWRHADNLAGYEQQDAHEFLISTLNGLHKHSGGSSAGACRCIVHQIFAGRLRSDLTCLRCGSTSTAIDPFFDISLDLPRARATGGQHAPQRQGGGGAHQRLAAVDDDSLASPKATNADQNSQGELDECNLHACLGRFTQAERLGSAEAFRCQSCNNTYQESIKQLSMESLPLVLCFHLKRFKQEGSTTTTSSKIDTHIRYPFVLDMSAYLSTTVVSRRLGRETPPPTPELYDLFAVVEHKGKIDNGHFVSFVRHESRWFKCDDATITPTQPHQIARSKGSYLLFYVRRSLLYEASPPNLNTTLPK